MNIEKDISEFRTMPVKELQNRYAELHGEMPRSRHRQYLIRKIAWRLQADAEGDLSQRARQRAEELADDAHVRTMPPREQRVPEVSKQRPLPRRVSNVVELDDRLPPPGAAITKKYRGRTIRVFVRTDGFDFEGERYPSLTAVAKAISGTHCNGYRFFGLGGRK